MCCRKCFFSSCCKKKIELWRYILSFPWNHEVFFVCLFVHKVIRWLVHFWQVGLCAAAIVEMMVVLEGIPLLSSIFLLSFSIQQQQCYRHPRGLAWVTNPKAWNWPLQHPGPPFARRGPTWNFLLHRWTVLHLINMIAVVIYNYITNYITWSFVFYQACGLW